MRGREEGGNLIGSVHRDEPVPAGHRLRPIRTLMDEGGAGQAEQTRRAAVRGEGLRLDLAGDIAARHPLEAVFSLYRERMRMDQTRALGGVVRWEINPTTPCQTVFTRHRGRFPEADVARPFLSGLLVRKPVIRLPSSDRCSVAAMMFEA